LDYIQVGDNVGYTLGGVNIGVIRNEREAILIDTGLDKDSGRKILRLLEEIGLSLEAIINTHSHADHFGGNAYLVRNTDAKVYASRIESGIIQNPILEPIYLFNGANPIHNLRNKFVLADPSPVDYILEPGKLSIIGQELDIIALPGHSFNQIGIAVDDVLFCADTVFSERVIDKYRVPVVQDVGKHLETLKRLKKTNYRLYIPSHTKPVEDITKLVDKNLRTTETILKDIKDLLVEPKTTEEIQSILGKQYSLNLNIIQQYYLIHMTLMAYLGYLYESQQTDIIIKENLLHWNIKK